MFLAASHFSELISFGSRLAWWTFITSSTGLRMISISSSRKAKQTIIEISKVITIRVTMTRRSSR